MGAGHASTMRRVLLAEDHGLAVVGSPGEDRGEIKCLGVHEEGAVGIQHPVRLDVEVKSSRPSRVLPELRGSETFRKRTGVDDRADLLSAAPRMAMQLVDAVRRVVDADRARCHARDRSCRCTSRDSHAPASSSA